MECVKCGKDITNARFKVTHKGKGLCWICYKKIPTKERMEAAKNR